MSNLKANVFAGVISKVDKAADQLGLTAETCLKMITTDVYPQQSFVVGSPFNTLETVGKNRIYLIYSFINANNPNFYDSVDELVDEGGSDNPIVISNDDGAYDNEGSINNS